MIIDPKFPYYQQMLADKFNPHYIIFNDLLQKTADFAQACAPTNQKKLAARGQKDMGRILAQIQAGKIGEQAIHSKLVVYLKALTEPDYGIYTSKRKNWNPDLTDATTSPITTVGCKAQEYQQSQLFGESWVCEYREGANYDRDNGVFGEEAKKPGHFMCFALVNVPKKWVELKALVAISTLHDKKLFEAMVKKNLQNNKVAIYMESIERVFANGAN